MSEYSCLILCGGKGERLLPLTEFHQKCMLPVFDIPFLEYIDYKIKDFGITKNIFCCGHKAEEIIRHFGTFKNYKYSCPANFISPGARVVEAINYFYKDDIVIVFNGDSFCNITKEYFWSIYNSFVESKADICKIMVEKSSSLLASFIPHKYESEYFGAGIYFFRREFLLNLEYDDKLSIENNIILENFDRCDFVKLPNNFFVIDIGTPGNYKLVNEEDNEFGKFFRAYHQRIIDKKTHIFP
jgi:NDP-sugar pyrophosphorylase family protein